MFLLHHLGVLLKTWEIMTDFDQAGLPRVTYKLKNKHTIIYAFIDRNSSTVLNHISRFKLHKSQIAQINSRMLRLVVRH